MDISDVDITDTQRVNKSILGEYEVFGRAPDWTACNKCGNRMGVGETRRSIECYIRVSIFKLFFLEPVGGWISNTEFLDETELHFRF